MRRLWNKMGFVAAAAMVVAGTAGVAYAQDPQEAEDPGELVAPAPPVEGLPTYQPALGGAPGVIETTKTEIVVLQNADPFESAKLLELFGVTAKADSSRNAVVITGPEQSVDMAIGAIDKIDVAPPPVKNVEVIVYLVLGSKSDLPKGSEPFPPTLEPVEEQLRNIFGFSTFGLLETILLRGRDGSRIETSGMLRRAALVAVQPGYSEESQTATYQLSIEQIAVDRGDVQPARIAIDGFLFGTTIPELPVAAPQGGPRMRYPSNRDGGLRADIDVVENQMAIVGKAAISNEGDAAFVVVSAHVVEE